MLMKAFILASFFLFSFNALGDSFTWSEASTISENGVFPSVLVKDANSALTTWSSKVSGIPYFQLLMQNPIEAKTNPLLLGMQPKTHCLKPATASDRKGSFVIACEQLGSDGTQLIYLKVYRAKDGKWETKLLDRNKPVFTLGSPTPAVETLKTLDVAMSEDGQIWTVWITRSGFSFQGFPLGQVWISRYEPTKGWGKSVKLDTNHTVKQATDPRIKLDAKGNAMVLWTQFETGPNAQTLWQRYFSIEKKAWMNLPTVLEKGSVARSFAPDLAFDGKGNALVTWSSSGDILVRRFDSQGYFDQVRKLSTRLRWEFFAINPKVAMNTKGEAVISWLEIDREKLTTDVYAVRYSENSAESQPIWSTAKAIHKEVSEVGYNLGPIFSEHAVVINENADATVVWNSLKTVENKPQYSLWAARSELSLPWQEAKQIFTSEKEIKSPMLTIDSQSKHYLIWNEGNKVNYATGAVAENPTVTTPEKK